MRKLIVLLLFITLGIMALSNEPINDTIDTLAGATNDTYYVTIDDYAGATDDEDDEEEDDD
ncbi:MAG: hypothetical protein UMR38_01950 [Candidatus Izemoplasma sp.]|nr:hypothetical protein [Candidatus Izemoplasma sp.]